MPISLRCPNCGASYQVKDEMAGRRVKCRCGNAIQVPAAQQNDYLGASGLDPLGVGEPGAQWGVQAPAPYQAPLQAASSWGAYAPRARKGSADAVTIMELVASSLCILQGSILGIVHLIDFFDMLDAAKYLDAMGWLFAFTNLFASLAGFCMLAFGICVLIAAILRLVDGRRRMDWSMGALLACSIAFMGIHLLGLMLVMISMAVNEIPGKLIVQALFYKVKLWSLVWLLLLSLAPVFTIVVFALGRKRR